MTAAIMDRTLCLVSGYHDWNFPPFRAYNHGLRSRFALVLDTYRRDKGMMFFDVELFLRLVSEACNVIGYDAIEIRLTDEVCFDSFDALAQYYADRDELDNEPPEGIDLIRENQVVAIAITEFWTLVGGPSPYHDSYTISFYTSEDRSEELLRTSEIICADVAHITGFHLANQDKEPRRSWGSAYCSGSGPCGPLLEVEISYCSCSQFGSFAKGGIHHANAGLMDRCHRRPSNGAVLPATAAVSRRPNAGITKSFLPTITFSRLWS